MSRARYSRELRAQAVDLVSVQVKEYSSESEAIRAVAAKLGVGNETLRRWVRQSEVDSGARAGVTSDAAARIARLERELKETKRANEILKAAASFFARELDPRLPRS